MEAALIQISFGRRAAWLLRWALSVLCLLAGTLMLSRNSPYAGVWWLPVALPHAAFSLPLPSHFLTCAIIITVSTTAAFLGWSTLRDQAQRLMASAPCSIGYTVWLVFYTIAILLLAGLLEHRFEAQFPPAAYFLAATSLTLAGALAWCLAAMPWRFWWNWLRMDPRVLPTAAVAGAATYLGGHHLTTLAVAHSQQLVVPLQRATLRLVAVILGMLTNDVVFAPQQGLIGTAEFSVLVDVPCAGWEGIGLFCTLFGIYLWFYRRDFRFPRVLLLLPAGALIIWLCNAVRLVLLILLGSYSASVAIEGFHSVAGWLFFDAVTLTLVAASRRLRLFSNQATAAETAEAVPTPNVAAPYLVPLLTIIAASMLTRVFYDGFDLLYPVRFAAGGAALWLYRRRLKIGWNFSWSAVALGFAVFAIWLLLPQGDSDISKNAVFSVGLERLPAWGAGLWIMCRALAAIAVVPVAEELAFRGYLLRKLIDPDFQKVPLGQFTWASFLITSLLFGVLHARWLAGCVAGMIFAAALYRRGMLSDAILSHGLANALLAAYVLATHQWHLWG